MDEFILSGDVVLNDEIVIDGDIEFSGSADSIGFISITGSPYQNTQLKEALDSKFDEINYLAMTNEEIEALLK
ncbi:hypothetical protein [Anaerorhabdus sp.]|uniref:hypothetical protein n=1 Tax=Anaerorhabdus sp. TaxID=1872524 RepID=UPI002FC58A26